MSLLSKLNPLNWIKDALVSDYVGGLLRHAASFIGGLLMAKGLGSVQSVETFVSALAALLTDPQFISGIVALFGSLGASVANKKVP